MCFVLLIWLSLAAYLDTAVCVCASNNLWDLRLDSISSLESSWDLSWLLRVSCMTLDLCEGQERKKIFKILSRCLMNTRRAQTWFASKLTVVGLANDQGHLKSCRGKWDPQFLLFFSVPKCTTLSDPFFEVRNERGVYALSILLPFLVAPSLPQGC